MQKQQQNKWMQAESLFQKLAKEDEEARAVIDDLDISQDTINTLTVMAKKSSDELSEARKIAAEV